MAASTKKSFLICDPEFEWVYAPQEAEDAVAAVKQADPDSWNDLHNRYAVYELVSADPIVTFTTEATLVPSS